MSSFTLVCGNEFVTFDLLKRYNMAYTLNVKEINTKAAKYHYTVTDENGQVISERKSSRIYAACTINGAFYFGRVDLVGKGDHGRQLQYCQKMNLEPIAVAYLAPQAFADISAAMTK